MLARNQTLYERKREWVNKDIGDDAAALYSSHVCVCVCRPIHTCTRQLSDDMGAVVATSVPVCNISITVNIRRASETFKRAACRPQPAIQQRDDEHLDFSDIYNISFIDSFRRCSQYTSRPDVFFLLFFFLSLSVHS